MAGKRHYRPWRRWPRGHPAGGLLTAWPAGSPTRCGAPAHLAQLLPQAPEARDLRRTTLEEAVIHARFLDAGLAYSLSREGAAAGAP